MGALISSNTLRLEPDGLSYQTARVLLPEPPSNANTMVFYYKAYVDTWPENTTENGSSYAWNRHSFFGLSFNGSVSANTGGIVGFTNTNSSDIGASSSKSTWTSYFFNKNSGLSQVVPFSLASGSYNIFSYGHSLSTTIYNPSSFGAVMCLSTNTIGITGANKYLGIIRIAKNDNDPQRVIFSYGSNLEGLSSQNFSLALQSSATNWSFQNISLQEISNFRPNYLNPDLANTINFPRWVVAKWPSAVAGRNLVFTDIKVEYYL